MNDEKILGKIISLLEEDDISMLEDWMKTSKNMKNVSKNFYFPSYHLGAYIRMGDKYCFMLNKRIPTLEIASIDVDPDSRNLGYGSKFIDLFEKVAFNNDKNVCIELVHSDTLKRILKKRDYVMDSLIYDPDSANNWWKFK